MKEAFLILGSIGSGKSVVADFLLSDHTFEDIEYLGSDIYKTQFFDFDINVDDRGYRCADELVFYRLEQICKHGRSFVFEFCPTNLNKIETTRHILRKYAYNVTTFFVATENKEINVDRCKDRESAGADRVPERKVRNRYDEVLNRAIEMVALSNKIYFIDNSTEVPRLVARLTGRSLLLLDDSCKWFARYVLEKLA